jgi:hypothetical protein
MQSGQAGIVADGRSCIGLQVDIGRVGNDDNNITMVTATPIPTPTPTTRGGNIVIAGGDMYVYEYMDSRTFMYKKDKLKRWYRLEMRSRESGVGAQTGEADEWGPYG